MCLSLCKHVVRLPLVALIFLLSTTFTLAQNQSVTYQGRLTDGGTAPNANYDLQFALFDAASGGVQIGATQTLPAVAVSAGTFTVQLNFGANAFPGANRFIEIGARLTGTPSFAILTPRQPITSTPYAIRSLNAASADAVVVSGVPSGSGNYIQNNPASLQSGAFNISGDGTSGGTLSANVVNAATQYNIGGRRVFLYNSSNNVFVGGDAGLSNTSGFHNTFVGGNNGRLTAEGFRNSFFGAQAGFNNRTGADNTVIGAYADLGASTLTNATSIGANARVDQSNSLVLGSIAGVNTATATVNVGIGTTSPVHRLSVIGGPSWTSNQWNGSMAFSNGSAIGWQANTAGWHFGIGQTNGGLYIFQTSSVLGSTLSPATYNLVVTDGGNVGIGTITPDRKFSVNGNASKTGGGSWDVFSDERLKTIKGRFTSGLKAVMQLQPLRYEYKPDNGLGIDSPGEHFGFGAQAVQKIIPEAVSKNDKGYLLINNDPILLSMLNAIKEQQQQIETLRTVNAALNVRLRTVEKVLTKRRARSSGRRR